MSDNPPFYRTLTTPDGLHVLAFLDDNEEGTYGLRAITHAQGLVVENFITSSEDDDDFEPLFLLEHFDLQKFADAAQTAAEQLMRKSAGAKP
jgi:hypothetical protein